jgi:uncharacterized protein with NAD-binding domain and iron-sulfur cluster
VEEVRPAARTPVRGLYLAGDWTATGLPATIEGAVQSGNAAAREVMQAKGTAERKRECYPGEMFFRQRC